MHVSVILHLLGITDRKLSIQIATSGYLPIYPSILSARQVEIVPQIKKGQMLPVEVSPIRQRTVIYYCARKQSQLKLALHRSQKYYLRHDSWHLFPATEIITLTAEKITNRNVKFLARKN